MSAHKYLFLVARASECLFELLQKDSKIYLLEQRKAPNHSPDFIIITERCARHFFCCCCRCWSYRNTRYVNTDFNTFLKCWNGTMYTIMYTVHIKLTWIFLSHTRFKSDLIITRSHEIPFILIHIKYYLLNIFFLILSFTHSFFLFCFHNIWFNSDAKLRDYIALLRTTKMIKTKVFFSTQYSFAFIHIMDAMEI